MAIKGLLEGLIENLPEMEYPCAIFLLTKATKIPIGPTTDVSKFVPGFMLQMHFASSSVLNKHYHVPTLGRFIVQLSIYLRLILLQ